jgi:2-hydroxychromene-2-carboxylate isomerase
MTTVAFYYAIGSRYSYLASTQLAALESDTGCTVEWHPVNSVELIARRGSNPFDGPPPSGQYEWSYREIDAKRWAAYYQVPFVEPRKRVAFDSQVLALACTAAKRLGQVQPVSRQLFAAMYSDQVTKIDAEECVRRAGRCGIPTDTFRQALDDAETARTLEATIEQAIVAGVFGVPAFVVGGELFWGNDRLVLLRHHLMAKSC